MPAFIFVTGYFAKFSMKKTVKNMLYPYLLFQLFYLIFANLILRDTLQIQFITPYWIMWYLLALTIWSLLCRMLQVKNNGMKICITIGAIIVSLLIGYVPWIGRQFSLSRMIVFFPFYLAGYYCKDMDWKVFIAKRQRESRNSYFIALFLLINVFIFCSVYSQVINRNWLYEATGYARSHYGIPFRGVHLCVAFICIFILFRVIPDKKIPLLSSLGKNTLSVYLLHGFIIKLMDKYQVIKYIQNLPGLIETFALALIAVVLGFLLSRKIIVAAVNVVLGKRSEQRI